MGTLKIARILSDVKKSKRFRWIHSFSTGVDSFLADLNHAIGYDVVLTNARGASSQNLAEYALATMLYFNKRISCLQTNQKERNWKPFAMGQLKGKKVGLLGFGSIGSGVANLAYAMGMKIQTVQRSQKNLKTMNTSNSGTATYSLTPLCSAQELFRNSDFVISSLPATPKTYRMIDRSCFENMKPGCVFINLGRGSCVNEDDLIDYHSKFGGIALDVFDIEPLPSESKLWTLDNCLISPHNADFSDDWVEAGLDIFEIKLGEYILRQPFSTGVVDRAAGY